MYYLPPPPPGADDAKAAMPVYSLRVPGESSGEEEGKEDRDTESFSSSDSDSADGFVMQPHASKQSESSTSVSKRPADEDLDAVLALPPKKQRTAVRRRRTRSDLRIINVPPPVITFAEGHDVDAEHDT